MFFHVLCFSYVKACCSPATAMSRLEEAIKNIVDIFLEYAGEDPKRPKLTEEQLNKMLETEIKDPEIKVREIKH